MYGFILDSIKEAKLRFKQSLSGGAIPQTRNIHVFCDDNNKHGRQMKLKGREF
jgi:hypothetical protein